VIIRKTRIVKIGTVGGWGGREWRVLVGGGEGEGRRLR
jgi:hypothetical protein